MKYEDRVYKVQKSECLGQKFKMMEEGGKWTSYTRAVKTMYCYVLVDAFHAPFDKPNPDGLKAYEQTEISIIRDGLEHKRIFNKYYKPSAATTKAKQFANELFNGG